MSRIAIIVASVVLAAGSIGCRSWVGADKYERDIETLKETNRELSERNEKLESIAAAYDRLAADYQVEKTEGERYDEIAKLLGASLEGIRNDDGSAGMAYDPRRGVWTMATDLLFDSGCFTISPKGLEILKKFGDAYKSQDVRFRIVGHTDNARIVSNATKERLDTDTNIELSAKRAIAVFGQLLKSGLKESRFVEVMGLGNLQPAAPNDSSAANRRKNRRVEIFVVKGAGVKNTSTESPKTEKKPAKHAKKSEKKAEAKPEPKPEPKPESVIDPAVESTK